jgi:hypothetical protein
MDRTEDTTKLENALAQSNQRYRQSQGMFWDCSGACLQHKAKFEQAQHKLDEAKKRNEAIVSDAKVWSQSTTHFRVMKVIYFCV